MRLIKNILMLLINRLSLRNTTVRVNFRSSIHKDTIFGKHIYIGRGAEIPKGVVIDDYAIISKNLTIAGNDHTFRKVGVPVIFSERGERETTKIGKDVWIGANVFISAGVTIGDYSIIGAGSVVTKSIDSFSVVAGVPAKKIGERFQNEIDRLQHVNLIEKKEFKVKYQGKHF